MKITRSLVPAALLAAAVLGAGAEPFIPGAREPQAEVQSSDAGEIGGGGRVLDAVGPKAASAGSTPAARAQAQPPRGTVYGVAPRRAAPSSGSAPAAAPAAPVWDPNDARIASGLHACTTNPPKLAKLQPVVHIKAGHSKYILDVTPKVCDREFCGKVGFPGRGCCPLGPHGSPHRVACELFLLGIDPTDGVPGPRWTFQGEGTIRKRDENPFLAVVKWTGGGGTATVCSNRKPVVCGSVRVP